MSYISGVVYKAFPFLIPKSKDHRFNKEDDGETELDLGFGNNILNRQAEKNTVASDASPEHESKDPHSANADKSRITRDALQILQNIGLPSKLALNTFFSARTVQTDEEIFRQITEYITNGQEHGYGIKIINIIRLVRNGDMEFHHMESLDFRMMLWHGTEKSAIASILKDGFRLPKPSKQMFGHGVYFADRISKSCNYCFNSQNGSKKPKPGTKAFLLLCDVLLGNMYNAKKPHHKINKPPDNFRQTFSSVMCTGEYVPDRCFNKYFHGSILPCGPTIKNTKFPSYTIQYNEYIVYNTDKIRIQFLVEVEFLGTPVKVNANLGYNNNSL